MKTAKEILDIISAEGVEFIRLQFTDIFGLLKNVAVTAGQLSKVLVDKYRIDGAVLFDGAGTCGYEGELILEPDYDTFMILPWRPQQGKVAKFMCDVCYPDGTLFEMSPRTILKNAIDKAKLKGYTFMIRPECEFFLFHLDEAGLPTTITHEQAGMMDVGPVDLGENARREIVLLLEQMGFEIESSYHEKAAAQHEIDFKEADTLQAADAIMTFRFAVRSIARRFGLHATFMPKPKAGEAGSGMHLNFTVYKDEQNIMDGTEGVVNAGTRDFINGILKHSTALCAYTNPTVNSYKRILLALDDSKVKSDYDISTTYIRIREGLFEPAIELRFPDSAANPYLALALCISAGLEGIESGDGANIPMRLPIANVNGMPQNLKEAVSCAGNDPFIGEVVGDDFARIYTESKLAEWNRYIRDISDWEIENYLYKY
ncbi:MAG: glutamine synthetase family protein [Lachnospiraceae bacterium]|nr:glutamine synthetase family protein [Lachnospiraceae bacterium]